MPAHRPAGPELGRTASLAGRWAQTRVGVEVVGAASSGFFRVLRQHLPGRGVGGGAGTGSAGERERRREEGEWMSCSQVSVPGSHSEGLFKRGFLGWVGGVGLGGA